MMDDNGSDGNDSNNLSIDANDECVRRLYIYKYMFI